MTAHELKTLALTETTIATEKDEEYSIPLDISDIINICREYNKLGWHIQQQVESILEVGVEESIRSSNVKQGSLPYIESFLKAICGNPYFGDAVSQAHDCIKLIQDYQYTHKETNNFAVN